MTRSTSRRTFLKSSAVAAAAIGLPMVASSRVLGANDEIVAGHRRLRRPRCRLAHLPGFGWPEGRPHRGRGRRRPHPRQGSRQDARREIVQTKADACRTCAGMFERKDIDAVSIATMQYWHALPTIWACQAGQARLLREAAGPFHLGRPADGQRRAEVRPPGADRHAEPLGPRRTQRLAQWLKEGHLGKILYVTCFANKPRRSIGKRDRAAADSRDARLRPLVRPGPQGADLPRPAPIRLQLHLEHGRRRVVQPGRPRDRRRPLGAGRRHGLPRREMSIGGRFVVQRRRRRAQHADHLLRLPRGPDPLRSPQPAQGARSA